MAVLNSRINSQCGQLTLKRQPCALFFHHTVILLLLTDIRTDAVSKILEWGRPDLDPRFVHVWFEGQDHLVNQNPSYKGRTSLSTEKLKQGDLSLKLTRVNTLIMADIDAFFPQSTKNLSLNFLLALFHYQQYQEST
ncbi:uncharacterized protein LOC121812689 isoform X2 [Haplochromis burtoni]|uniref:uncharacterized protein LOC121812689 isoform X2 n=1 Tax=Haplochromis burtoni TaxID=8153 RepID=UPI001C2DAACD|nr:uncharacterized protein LOC121812689 isoform X2 [Haplochromis burtoni]